MKLRKSSLWVVGVILVVVFLGVLVRGVYNEAVTLWEDQSTWSTEKKVILPKETESLKVSNVVTNGPASNEKEFTFKVDYCYLYDIEESSDGENATVKCSLLPYYYAEREQEKVKDWNEKVDIKIVVNKSDPLPSEFLGRIDKSFSSVSTLGGGKYPVSIEVKGKYSYPKETIFAKLEHYMKAKRGSKDEVKTTLTSYSVMRLDEATELEKSEYASKWKKEMLKQIKGKITDAGFFKTEGQLTLNWIKDFFVQHRIRCYDLSTCRDEYISNPAEAFLYSVLSMRKDFPEYYEKSLAAMKLKLAPFNGITYPVGDGESNWIEFNNYEFPICLLKDFDVSSKSNAFLTISPLFTPEPGNSLDVAQLQKSLLTYDREYLTKTYMEGGVWPTEQVDKIGAYCYYAAQNSTDRTAVALAKKVFNDVLSVEFGMDFDGSKKAMNEYIFQSNAFSPYKNLYLTDSAVSRAREDGVQTSAEAAASYTEWKSFLHTYIMLYLYD